MESPQIASTDKDHVVPQQSQSGDARTPAASRVLGEEGTDRTDKARRVAEPTVLHCDIIGDVFWLEHPGILG